MSDILIRGMEMPKSCADCFLEDPYDGYNCRIIPKSANWGLGERPSWCPLVEVPTPHGDLIDRDALRDNNCDVFEINGADGTILAMDVSIIDDAPIIIPASEEET